MSSKLEVFVVCTGLGYINRGYESFTREVFDALDNQAELNCRLFKGKGRSAKNEYGVFNFNREGKIARWLKRYIGKDTYYYEQLSFFFFFIPYILLYRPKIILFSDFYLGCFLYHLKRFLKLRYKLLYSNGAPNGPPFHFADHVQQLLPFYYDQAIEGGENPKKHTILPYGVALSRKYSILNKEEKKQLRNKYGIPSDVRVILSVGAVNTYHKRIDYLIDEFTYLDSNDNYLLIVGQIEDESHSMIAKANSTLKGYGYQFLSLPYEQMSEVYQLADDFVLASLSEGFGRVFLEALSAGLKVFTHDYPVSRQVLGEHAFYGDFSKKRELATLLQMFPDDDMAKKIERVEYVKRSYSWDVLKSKYVDMLKKL